MLWAPRGHSRPCPRAPWLLWLVETQNGEGRAGRDGGVEHEEVPHIGHISWEAGTVLTPLHRPRPRDGRDLARAGRIK